MKRMTSAEVRRAFRDFFANEGHEVVASSSLVPGNDPTLLFTNAGMVQFKDVFLGQDKRPYKRATTSQKSMRISGKHNDLENVGPSPRHHTFFEMLGNFSFGDYFKRDAICFAYDLLTKVYSLPVDRLAFTVYKDDDEAYRIWLEDIGVDAKRVARMGPKTNFWQMAETGPCGPTSEIHWDQAPDRGEDGIIDALTAEDDRFLELWNLVFMQFNRTQADPQHSGQYDQPLPAPGVDTGMGLERITAVIQEAGSNYDTDLFTDIMDATQEILGHDDAFRQQHYVAYRVIADHTRGASFLIADGVNPGPTGREYIVRMLIRRAWRFAHSMGVEKPFLSQVAEAVIHKMATVYPELQQFRESIRYQILTEEDRFRRVLETSLDVLGELVGEMRQRDSTQMNGEHAFVLYSTHGLPLEITRDLLQEHGMSVDEEGFRAAQDEHSRRSTTDRDAFENVSIYQETLEQLKQSGALAATGTEYNPYDYRNLTFSAPVIAILSEGEHVKNASRGAQVELVLPVTSFYVESGGQMSDTGIIAGDGWSVEVAETRRPVGGLITHVGKVTSGTIKEGDRAKASVDVQRRWDIMRNHTATHLLHAALRNVLGEHVRQKGSLVAPDRLRFDFTHNQALTQDEMDRIAEQINAVILVNEPIQIMEKSLDEAKRDGAMALFGEKYGAKVRTVTICEPMTGCADRYSYELCGGTHVQTTAEIGPFLVVREEPVGAGTRRIEAITGREAQGVLAEQRVTLNYAAALLNTQPESLLARIEALTDELTLAKRTIDQLQRASAREGLDSLLDRATQVDGVTVIAAEVSAPDPEILAEMADWCRDRLQSAVVVLGSNIEGTARLVAKITPDVQARGVHAGKLVGEVAKLVGGGGGGRPDFATAGGKKPSDLPEALARVNEMVAQTLK
jgi:alanyl-tRNA synthetase